MATYRNEEALERIKRWFVLVAFAGLGIGGLGLVRLLASRANTLGSVASGVLAATGAVGLLIARRTGRVSVRTSREGVEIRNVISTRRFAWPDLETFEEIPRPRGAAQVQVRTRTGKTYPISACGDAGATAKKITQALNQELAAARG